MATLTEIILKLTKRMYSTGRAFLIPASSDIEKMHIGLNVSEEEAFVAATSGILDTILADNDNFTTDDAADWERRLAIRSTPLTSLDDRKTAILRKYATPGDIPARQHWLYIQTQLQASGFNVFVHENKFPVIGTWVNQSAASAITWEDIAKGNGKFVAIASSGADRVQTSPDGITWTIKTAASLDTWRSITFGNNRFVAVSDEGTIMHSDDDGDTWTLGTTEVANQFTSVTFGINIFVALTSDGTRRVQTSTDGINFVLRDASDNASVWKTVAFGNQKFVAFASTGTVLCMTSPDGLNWTSQSIPNTNVFTSVTFGNGKYVAVSNTGTKRVLTSLDAITWIERDAADNTLTWSSVTFGKGIFIAVASSGAGLRTMRSIDGVSWIGLAASQDNTWNAVIYGATKYVAISSDGTNRVMTLDGPTTYTTVEPSIVISNQYGLLQYGFSQYGPGVSTALVANFVDTAKDSLFVLPSDLAATFFIGAEEFGVNADVSASREDEFRQLILTLKPAQTIGVLLINYT